VGVLDAEDPGGARERPVPGDGPGPPRGGRRDRRGDRDRAADGLASRQRVRIHPGQPPSPATQGSPEEDEDAFPGHTLRPLPPNARRVPHTDSDVFGVDLDDWASNRDGAPREKLDIQPDPVPALAGEIATLSEGAFKALDDLTVLGRSRRTSKFSAAGRELRRAGLIDDPGALTETGEWVATHLRNGRHMAVAADSSPPQLLTLWIGDMTVLAISHLTDTATGRITHRIVHCLTDDIPRLVFMWLELQPSWDMTFEITCSQAELIAKLQTGAPPGTVPDGDAAEFTRRRWVAVSLIGPDDDTDAPEVAWAMARPRGVALLTKGTDADRVVVSRNPAEPFWQVLTRALLNLAEGEES